MTGAIGPQFVDELRETVDDWRKVHETRSAIDVPVDFDESGNGREAAEVGAQRGQRVQTGQVRGMSSFCGTDVEANFACDFEALGRIGGAHSREEQEFPELANWDVVSCGLER